MNYDQYYLILGTMQRALKYISFILYYSAPASKGILFQSPNFSEDLGPCLSKTDDNMEPRTEDTENDTEDAENDSINHKTQTVLNVLFQKINFFLKSIICGMIGMH